MTGKEKTEREEQDSGKARYSAGRSTRRWLEIVLILAGVVLLTAGGLLAHAQQAMPEVPAPVGAPPESLLPPKADRPQGDAAGLTDGSVLPSAGGRDDPEILAGEQDARVRPWPLDPDAAGPRARAPTPTITPAVEQESSDQATNVLAEPQQEQSDPPPALSPIATNEPTSTPEPTTTPEPTATPTPTPFPPAESPPYRLTIRAIGVDTPVIPVGWVTEKRGDTTITRWEAADYAAGWHQNSRLPGQGGNVVVAGHNNIRGEVFRDLEQLNPGDRIIVYADRRPYIYEVESRFMLLERGQPIEVQRENARWIGEFPEERLTLISCWPYTTYNYRIIVVALPAW